MDITRIINGEQHIIELTDAEIEKAYRIQERKYDTDDVIETVDNRYQDDEILEEFGVSKETIFANAEYIGELKREYLYEDATTAWDDAVMWAIHDFAEETKKAGG
jgi:hypothetical protein